MPVPPTEVTQSTDQDQEVDDETEYDEEVNGSEEESEPGDYETLHPLYKRIKVKYIKELHSAVKHYGIHAPFTFSILEGLAGDGFLLPLEWSKVVQSVLTRGQYLTWKSEFQDRSETMARQNRKNPLSQTASWTADKISGRGKFADKEKQKGLSLGILSQTAQAALAAWRAVPSADATTTPLTKIIQGPQESYAQFMGRLQDFFSHGASIQ